MPPPSQQTKEELRRAHVQQLAGLSVHAPSNFPKQPTGGAPSPTPDELLPIVLGWINDNPAAVEAAKASGCTSSSPDSPNWDAIFFTLVESVGMYLRKEDEVAQAILAAQAGDTERAIAHLQASEELIHKLAEALDCTFVQLCDFADRTPDGRSRSSGAYAGLFISNGADKPFAGVAFKGSDSKKDVWTDIDWVPITPLRPEIAWGAQIHRGFYHNLFGEFTAGGKVEVPFDVLIEQLSSAFNGNAKLHFTGHSLGGGLCTLAFGEFLRRETEPAFAKFNIGDLYSLAAPRTCYPPFSDEVNRRTQAGGGRYSFRIVNSQDPVPMVPPPPPPFARNVEDFPFVHVAGGWRITLDGPEKMGDEPPPVVPPPVLQMVARDHDTRRYYASWQKTPHS